VKFSTRLLVAAAALPLVPAAAWACPACMVTDPKNAGTYLGMTLMMSALPLGLIGGLAYWLWRRYSQTPGAVSGPRPAMNAEFLAEMADPPKYPCKTA